MAALAVTHPISHSWVEEVDGPLELVFGVLTPYLERDDPLWKRATLTLGKGSSDLVFGRTLSNPRLF